MNPFRQIIGSSRTFIVAFALAVCGSGMLPQPSAAQNEVPGFDNGGLFDKAQFPGEADSGDPITVEAAFKRAEGTRQGRLEVTAKLKPMWHVYSVTQGKGGPLPTKIQLAGADAKVTGPFVPDEEPLRSVSEQWPGVNIEEHEEKVVWTAPIEFAGSAKPDDAKLTVNIEGLTCQPGGSCIPFEKKLSASFAGTYQPTKTPAVFRDKDSAVQWKIQFESQEVKAGDVAKLRVTAIPDDGYHVYAAATDDRQFATNFVITRKGPLKASAPKTASKPITSNALPGVEQRYHEDDVTWTIDLMVPKDATVGGYPIEGFIGYQACTDTSCLQPRALQFAGILKVTDSPEASPAALSIQSAPRAEVMDAAAMTEWLEQTTAQSTVKPVTFGEESDEPYPLALVIVMALGAGLILNLMPCVLPVLGLKIMAFADQAGQDRKEVFATNMWYSLGIMSVFWLLAAAVALLSFSWGEQFTYFEFRLAMTVLVFAFALSFFGVWEIPVPGFAAGEVSQDLQHREGAVGSFSKGVFTTLLATPCSGPLLGLVLSLMLGERPVVIFAVFTAMGLGMALPFLAIAINPRLVAWMPRPGNWMETLKEFLAFVLLGTVAFFFAMFDDADKLPVFICLIGVWFGCWLIGRVPHWAPLPRRLTAWTSGIACATVIGFLAFNPMPFASEDEHLAWEPYSEARLVELQEQGKTVLIDFTAKWCVNCHVNYMLAINTEKTGELVRELDAVVMLADWTDRDESIKRKLNELESNAIPVLAIYPGARPDQPIVLRDLISQGDVLDALKMAGPSTDQDMTAIALRTE